MKYVLGIDTSCYTTSMAGVTMDGELLFNKQLILDVPEGSRGLRQSEAVFHHLKNLPEVTSYIRNAFPDMKPVAVCSSIKPRPQPDSYMPVFLFSHNLGQALSDLLGIPFYGTSHQENHIMAGIHSAKGPYSGHFLAMHLSGGTSELLDVYTRPSGFDIKIIGASQDLPAGQFVDRLGVAMGLPFPAGPYLETLAENWTDIATIPCHVKDLTVSFSGPETHGRRIISQGADHGSVAKGVYQCLIQTFGKWIMNAVSAGYSNDILLVGGVSSSRIIREGLQNYLRCHNQNLRLFFAEPGLSRDNAAGAALIGLKAYLSTHINPERTDDTLHSKGDKLDP